MDLLIGLAATAATAVLSLMTDGPLRVVVGSAFIVFIPGYCLIAALYPQREQLDMAERLALSFGTSICVAPLLMLALNHTQWGVRLIPVLATLGSFNVIMCIIATVRRSRIYPPARYALGLPLSRPSFHSTRVWLQALSALRLAFALLAIGVLVYVTLTPKQAEEFTEFYVLHPGGTSSDYPVFLRQGEPAALIIGITSHEAEPVTYTISAQLQGKPSAVELQAPAGAAVQTSPYSLVTGPIHPGDTWKHEVRVTGLIAGEGLKLEFLLHAPLLRDGYHLWAALDGGGDVVLQLQESRGRMQLTVHAGANAIHHCRIEAWQDGTLTAHHDFSVHAGGKQRLTLRHPPGPTEYRLYDNGTQVINDSGVLLNLHLWVDVR